MDYKEVDFPHFYTGMFHFRIIFQTVVAQSQVNAAHSSFFFILRAVSGLRFVMDKQSRIIVMLFSFGVYPTTNPRHFAFAEKMKNKLVTEQYSLTRKIILIR